MQAIGNDPSLDNGSATRCDPQAAEDSDDDDNLQNWDDDDAGERTGVLPLMNPMTRYFHAPLGDCMHLLFFLRNMLCIKLVSSCCCCCIKTCFKL
jgi:hypothetical protein